ncbi:MAG: 6-bladed beta-propeller [Candidatus Cloacimonetes bacterium]|nr:6-bladed beta-propeller [Candidatus Cloacimonadota bacterium]
MNNHIYTILLIAFVLLSCTETSNNDKVTHRSKPLLADEIKFVDEIFEEQKISLPEENTKEIGRIVDFSLDGFDNIYLLDNNSHIYKFNSRGEFIAKLNSIGRGPKEYAKVQKFCVNKDGLLFLDDWRQSRIQIYDTDFVHIGTLEKKTGGVLTDMLVDDRNNRLYCFDSHLENPVAIYDLKNNEFLKSVGFQDELVFRYSTRIKAGGMFLEGDELYYTLPNQYKIFSYNTQNEKESILAVSPSFHFKQVDEKIKSFRDSYNYSTVGSFYKVENYFFVRVMLPKESRLRDSDYSLLTDIISAGGEKIKEGVFYKNIKRTPRTVSQNTLLSYDNIVTNEKNKTNIIILRYE